MTDFLTADTNHIQAHQVRIIFIFAERGKKFCHILSGNRTTERAWEYLQTMDRQDFKSYSQVISLALVDYFDRYYRTQAVFHCIYNLFHKKFFPFSCFQIRISLGIFTDDGQEGF